MRAPAPSTEYLDARAHRENFPVASLLLPRPVREHLLAIYGFARMADELGDETPGDRLTALDWLEAEVDRAFDGTPEHPAMRRLSATVRALDLPREEFIGLIEANRRDQVVTRYGTFDELLGYCELSANPVGRLVLSVFDASTPERIRRSDAVCTGLQLVEHWQDVGEDYRRGRMYLPQEDLERYGCDEDDLARLHPTPQLRELLAFEVGRACSFLAEGRALVRSLPGRQRVAVAGFVGGGRAAADAIRRSGFDVLRTSPRAGRVSLLGHVVRALW
jgi:squalene synthase HpnC